MATTRDGTESGQPNGTGHRWEAPQAVKHLATRTAEEDARFMLDLLRPGMHLLDCGCGPGTITLGLAARAAPGQVVGLDVNANLIEQARAAAHDQGIDNAKFEMGDVLALPYEDDTFDIVFSHALLEHLPNPMDGLAEMWRVLKPGGGIALRVPDWDGNISYPDVNNHHARFLAQHEKYFRHNGSDPYRGRQIGEMLYALGAEDVRMTASYTAYGTPQDTMAITDLILDHFFGAERMPLILEQGWATQAEMDQLRADLTEWAGKPGAFHARAWVEAVARKP